jgi:hypothetical protein
MYGVRQKNVLRERKLSNWRYYVTIEDTKIDGLFEVLPGNSAISHDPRAKFWRRPYRYHDRGPEREQNICTLKRGWYKSIKTILLRSLRKCWKWAEMTGWDGNILNKATSLSVTIGIEHDFFCVLAQ